MLQDVNDIAAMLGMTTKQVYYYCRQGTLPHIRLGRQIKFSGDQIQRWLDDGGSPLSTPGAVEHSGGRHED